MCGVCKASVGVSLKLTLSKINYSEMYNFNTFDYLCLFTPLDPTTPEYRRRSAKVK